MLVMLICLMRWNNKENLRDIIKFTVASVAGYAIGLIIFRLIIMQFVKTYFNSSVALNRLLPETINHLKHYFSLVKSDFKTEWLVLIALLCIAFVFVAVRDSKQKKYFAFPVAVLTLLAMLVMSFGIYPVLASPHYAPRAMYGFGAFVVFVGVFVVNTHHKVVYPAKLISLLLSWAFFVFAFTYGNALFAQKTYTDFRITEVIDDLIDTEIISTDEVKTVQISGSIGQVPVIRNMPKDYQMLNRLIPINFRDSSWYWGYVTFSNYYGLRYNMVWDSSIDLSTYDLPLIKDTVYHTIYGNDKYVLIELK